MFRLLLDTALKTVTCRWQVIKIVETLVHRQIRFIPIKEGIEFDGQQDLRTKVMIAAGSYVVFQHQSGRSPYPTNFVRQCLAPEESGQCTKNHGEGNLPVKLFVSRYSIPVNPGYIAR